MTGGPGSPLTVCYNGFCPLCRAEIGQYKRLAAARGLAIAWRDVVAEPALLEAHGLDFDRLLRRLHVVDGAGKVLGGVDAFAALWRQLPYYRPLGRFLATPIGRPLGWFVYEILIAPALYALNRRRLRRRTGAAASGPG